MGKETTLFKSEERKTRAEVSDFLRQLAGKIDSGEVILKQGDDELPLSLSENLILDIKAEDEEKSRGIQHSLEVEIKWFDGDDEAPGSLELG
ncbi:MAG: amphi-Trp domain-containing protein [Balneolaceae bacterium]|nr:amphi-Trp domain-containing protein [Balneolaceae bacterium]MCH8549953.1 amphi-Trp domain-containing protein [Balneolaceae bacterium]